MPRSFVLLVIVFSMAVDAFATEPRWAIFETEEAAKEYVAAVDTKLGFPRCGNPCKPKPQGWTLTWAVPLKHPTRGRWAVQIEGRTGAPTTGAVLLVPVLSDDWEP